MLSYSEIKKGVMIIFKGDPYKVIESSLLFKGRGHSVLQTKLRNLATGEIISKTFQPADVCEEAEIEEIDLKFIYSHQGKYVFSLADKPSQRIELGEKEIGPSRRFLKPNETIKGLSFKGKIINISLPLKVLLRVTEAPPGIRFGRAEAGTKQVTLESGAKINAPLFIKEGDVLEVNTETGEYVRRVEN